MSNDMQSVRVDVWAQLKADNDPKVQAERAAALFAELRSALDAEDATLKHLFSSYEQVRADLDAVGVLAQMKLTPVLEAAYGEWLRTRENTTRLPISELSEAPIPPEDAA